MKLAYSAVLEVAGIQKEERRECLAVVVAKSAEEAQIEPAALELELEQPRLSFREENELRLAAKVHPKEKALVKHPSEVEVEVEPVFVQVQQRPAAEQGMSASLEQLASKVSVSRHHHRSLAARKTSAHPPAVSALQRVSELDYPSAVEMRYHLQHQLFVHQGRDAPCGYCFSNHHQQ